MLYTFIKKLFGTRNSRLLRQYRKLVAKINHLEPTMKKLSDEALRAQTDRFRDQLNKGISLESLLPEAFALVREASSRVLGMRHFDVQLIGGMVLHYGKVAEMRTGEGKTLAATLPAYLNALSGKGVHIITVNDYLAKRDARWMAPIYEYLGLSVAANVSESSPTEKQQAYAADITYGTNNEFGFDYLRDNMVASLEDRVQRPLHYTIIDEVDSILIDEARTPLIISGVADESSECYYPINQLIPQLKRQMQEEDEHHTLTDAERGDFTVDEKNRQVFLTEQGHQKMERLLVKTNLLKEGDSLYDLKNIGLMHYVNASLRAHTLYQRDVHYVVKDKEVLIVDEHTGRLMSGRRWSEGLHQAVEVKEGVPVQLENKTLATITLQNYFRLYQKLSGMTGTADTEAYELQKIYGLEVVVIPTNKAMVRDDRSDKVFLTLAEKNQAIINDIREAQQRKQPILVGTASVESSEYVSQLLRQAEIQHEVLNAKQHEREAHIIARAGMPGVVTIATNMAGRGTDIVLGGNLEDELAALSDEAPDASQKKHAIRADWQKRHDTVIQAGGLYVLGTERHESRRIDNQLRGRSGRQGDPGLSQFYLSFEDNLLRIFAADRMSQLMRRLGLKKGETIQHAWINKAIENAQRRVEGLNFDIRKQLLEYDDVANDQRKVIYLQRYKLLQADDIADTIVEIREEVVRQLTEMYVPPQSMEEQWDIPSLEAQLQQEFGLSVSIAQWLEEDTQLHGDNLAERIVNEMLTTYQAKEALISPDVLRQFEKNVMLQCIDTHWQEHLSVMDHLRHSIHLQSYAQKNPVQEYKKQSFDLFTDLLSRLKQEVISILSSVNLSPESDAFLATQMPGQPIIKNVSYQHDVAPSPVAVLPQEQEDRKRKRQAVLSNQPDDDAHDAVLEKN